MGTVGSAALPPLLWSPRAERLPVAFASLQSTEIPEPPGGSVFLLQSGTAPPPRAFSPGNPILLQPGPAPSALSSV